MLLSSFPEEPGDPAPGSCQEITGRPAVGALPVFTRFRGEVQRKGEGKRVGGRLKRNFFLFA